MSLFDILNLIPQGLQQEIVDSFVDFVSRQAEKFLGDQVAEKLKKLRSDAAFVQAFQEGLRRAADRFVQEYETEDEDLVAAIAADERFFQNEQVQKALLAIIKRPGTYLEGEREMVLQSFETVLPGRKHRGRVDRAVTVFLKCLAEELWALPELQGIYSFQFRRMTAEATRQQVELQKAQLQATVGLSADIRQALLQLTGAMAQEKLLPAPEPPALPAPPQVYHNLPPRSEFIGREAEKARVHKALQSRPYLVSINGIGGIGKTVLALEVAHECLRASKDEAPTDGIATFDGFIWATAKDRDLTLNDLLNAVSQTLEYPGIAQQPLEEKLIAVQKLLREKPCLLVVDNFETITDNRVRDFLLNLPEPSKALITTREQKLRQVWSISLKGLAEPEALALIRSAGRRLWLASLERAEDRVLRHLYEATGGAPLSIKWAVGQIGQRGQSLDSVLAALHAARGDIFDSIFARSWDLLSVDARQVLLVMSLFAASASRAGIEAASNVHHFALDEALGQLVEMSLVDATDELELSKRRYSIHPLTRAFATAKLQHEPETQAFERILDYYKQLVTPPPEVRVGVPYWDGLTNYAQSESLKPEWNNLAHIIRLSLDQRCYVAALDLFLPIVHFLHIWGLWDERLHLSREMCQAAHELRDPVEVWLWIDAIGHALHQRQQFLESIQALRTGRTLARKFDLPDAVILADAFEANLHRAQGDTGSAIRKIESALEQLDPDSVFERGTPVQHIVARRVVSAAGLLSLSKGDVVRAKEMFERALELRLSVGENPSPTLSNLAHVSLQLNDIASAEKYLAEASVAAGQRDIAWINYEWAVVAEKRGELQEAWHLGTLALKQFTRLGYRRGAQECQEFLARLQE